MATYKEKAKQIMDTDITDVMQGQDLFLAHRKDRIKENDITGTCVVYWSDDGLKMKCGHFVSPDGLLDSVWQCLKMGFFTIYCPQCPSIIEFEEILSIGRPSELEHQFIETAININYCLSLDIIQCPKCSSFCERKDTSINKTKCTVCTKETSTQFWFCWYCLHTWNNSTNPYDYDDCGNSDCQRVVLKQLNDAPKKTFKSIAGHNFNVPSIRACPACLSLVEHKEKCPDMSCKMCKHKFCFICLRRKAGKSDDTPTCPSVSVSTTQFKIECHEAPVQRKLIKN